MDASVLTHSRPFIVVSLPRSRSYWLSRLLDSPARPCGHDTLMEMVSISQFREQFERQWVFGTVETGLARHWRIAMHEVPEARFVALMRDPSEVEASLKRIGLEDPELSARAKDLERLAAAPGTLVIEANRLGEAPYVASIWQALHGVPCQLGWIEDRIAERLDREPEELRARLAATARGTELLLAEAGAYWPARAIRVEKIELAENIQEVYDLAQEHYSLVSGDLEPRRRPSPDFETLLHLERAQANHFWFAYVDSRVAGYVSMMFQRDVETAGMLVAHQGVLYVRPAYGGLGLGERLLRTAVAFAKGAGASYAYLHHRTYGPSVRVGALARRLGGRPLEQTYSLDLEAFNA